MMREPGDIDGVFRAVALCGCAALAAVAIAGAALGVAVVLWLVGA